MSPALLSVAVASVLYLIVVGALGAVAARRSGRSPEEYFLAGRGLGRVVLFMSLFGTNCTSFVLVAIPGLAWNDGVGVFGLNAAIVALGVPLTFFAIGSPARRMGARLQAVTPSELLGSRLDSPRVGALAFLIFTVWTVPYMVQGIQGAGLVLEQATDGELSAAWAGFLVLLTVLAYTSAGGMRGTAWTNVFQGALFMVFVVVAFLYCAHGLGGFSAATDAVADVDPSLLVRGSEGRYAPGAWASWGLVISLTVIAFPHMLVRIMSARDDVALRSVVRVYPIALAVLWLPIVMIGVWGRGAFPELERGDAVFYAMTSAHLPAALSTLAFLAVLAAVMSTLDAQVLTLSSMLVRDVLEPLGARLREGQEVLFGRAFTLLVGGIVFVLAQTWDESLFAVSRRAFEGYTMLVPTLFLALRWRRFNAPGAFASLLAGNALLIVAWIRGDVLWLGLLPAAWAFLVACLAGVGGALMTAPTAERVLERAFARSGPTT